ncbi:glycosyltransferase family 9 protein, partial [Proteus mirabilis]|uniref:glycosyltransferase family 9 protein n=1 Tax=Proteus mirabilis TaxID=584 RepID=UPI00257881FD
YARLAKKLINEYGYQIFLFCSQNDRSAGEEIIHTLTPDAQAACINLAGHTSLEQAVNLIAACKAVVSNDAGLMNVAAALE